MPTAASTTWFNGTLISFTTTQRARCHGLLVAGIKNLRSSEEIQFARERGTAQTGLDPLRQYSLDSRDLKEFIDACIFDRITVKNDRELRERFCKK